MKANFESSTEINSNRTTSNLTVDKLSIPDNELSTIDIDVQVQTERMNCIFEETISKTAITVYLLLANQEDLLFLKSVLSVKDYTLVNIFFKNNINYFADIGENKNEMFGYVPIGEEQVKMVFQHPVPKICPELCEIINIINRYDLLKPVVQNKMTHDNKSPLDVILYLDSMVRLKNKIIDKLMTSAAEKLKREVLLRNLNITNRALKLKINDVTKKIKQEQHNFNSLYEQKNEIIGKYQDKYEMLKNDSTAIIKQKIFDWEKQIITAKHAHKFKYEKLYEEDKEYTKKFQTILNDHLNNEKVLRAKRYKVETKLLSWLHKYDKEIGDKQADLDDLTQKYENELAELNEWQVKFAAQEILYIPLMEEKEEEYQIEIKTKMTNFLMEHAARVIQRAWRRVLAARAEKRRLKKLAGKRRGKK